MMVKDAFDRWWEWAEKPAGSTRAQSMGLSALRSTSSATCCSADRFGLIIWLDLQPEGITILLSRINVIIPETARAEITARERAPKGVDFHPENRP
jgi:hypothetical protein